MYTSTVFTDRIDAANGKEYFKGNGFYFIFRSAFEWVETPNDMLAYMYNHVPINRIPTFIRVCELTAELSDSCDWHEFPWDVSNSHVTMELFQMCVSYPNLSEAKVLEVMRIVVGAATTGILTDTRMLSEMSDETRERIRSIWLVWDDETAEEQEEEFTPVSMVDTGWIANCIGHGK